MRHNRYLTFLLILSAATSLFIGPVSAAPPPATAQAEQPISIYADTLSIDDSTGISLYSGHVELQQGDLKFSGDKLEITQKEGSITLMRATGQPALFRRGDVKQLKADASRIEYDSKNGLVILQGNAHLWQNGNQFSGELIRYYINSRRVQAQGDSGAAQGSGRVHVLIRPKEAGN